LPVTAVLLAGGSGKRIGGNKLFLASGGVHLFEITLSNIMNIFERAVVACRPGDRDDLFTLFGPLLRRMNVSVVCDSPSESGPLAGMAAAFALEASEWYFVSGCDMPDVRQSVASLIWSCKNSSGRVIAPWLSGYPEPLHSFYHSDCLSAVKSSLQLGERKITSIFHSMDVTAVPEETLRRLPGYRRSFTNINTPDDLKKWLLWKDPLMYR